MMKKRLRLHILFSFVTLLLISGLSGCLTKDSSIYGQERVLEYVDSICPEPYELTETELIEENPDNMEYEFRTLKRDLTFHANSFLSPIWIDATQTPFYSRSLSCDYVTVVHDLYRDELKQVLEHDSHYMPEYGWYYLLSFQDIENAVDTLLAADQVYRQELSYNPPEFLTENPLASIHFVWHRSEAEMEAHESWVNMTDIGITGQNSRRELYDRLAGVYAQLYVDGKIDRDDVPEEYLAGRHVSTLHTIRLNGREMLYDSNDNPYGPYGLTTDDYRYCWYSKELDSYMMVIDIGLITDNMSFPLIIREYVRALGGSYEASARESVYSSTWKIGENTWSMKAEYDDNTIHSLEIEKNREPLELSWITSDDDIQVAATFCAGVTVEDFCSLFDLTYTVNEEEGTISFEQK